MIFMKRKGQTVVEYILVTVSLLIIFVIMFRALQWACKDSFIKGAKVIVRTYVATP